MRPGITIRAAPRLRCAACGTAAPTAHRPFRRLLRRTRSTSSATWSPSWPWRCSSTTETGSALPTAALFLAASSCRRSFAPALTARLDQHRSGACSRALRRRGGWCSSRWRYIAAAFALAAGARPRARRRHARAHRARARPRRGRRRPRAARPAARGQRADERRLRGRRGRRRGARRRARRRARLSPRAARRRGVVRVIAVAARHGARPAAPPHAERQRVPRALRAAAWPSRAATRACGC